MIILLNTHMNSITQQSMIGGGGVGDGGGGGGVCVS